jgi:acetyl esterase/lipase
LLDRRTMLAATVTGIAGPILGATAFPANAWASGSEEQTKAPLWFVHPQLRAAAKRLATVRSGGGPATASLSALREAAKTHAEPPLTTVRFAKRTIAGPKGGPDVTVFVVNSKPGLKRPGILHMHYGGFIVGSATIQMRDLQEVASTLDCAIVSVEYRLAPEATWRASLEDNYAGLRWLYKNADEIGVDPARLAVMGESAGGGHAALLAIAARDRGEVPLKFQCLMYPMLDDRTGSARQVPSPIGTLNWGAAANRFGWASFLGQEPGSKDVPIAAVPARTIDVSGLPPAWIGVGSIDLFVEEDIAYAQRLLMSGVMTELLVVPGAFHGFDFLAAGTSLAQSFKASRLAALRRALLT